ncbi:MAG: trehalose-6-phosphate phosphatase [Sodalis sp. Psp]|nr:trehalose-6-phosphate phosphatase [Sodalis sp. Psp]MCR3756912.1 trehalose-6-phosphate phosphatase [Sodalis sp. Ppy]
MIQNHSIPILAVADTAFFFDLDGTLTGIEAHPERVAIPIEIKQALCKLSATANGAVALVSGRSVAELDSLSTPFHGPAAGSHGAERRDARGKLHRVTLPTTLSTTLGRELRQAIATFDGCHVEEKGMAFALHYRQGKQYKDQLLALIHQIVYRHPELVLQSGKCVVELKPAGVNKGTAIKDFMQEAPFAERTPLFIGDDLTDESGFKQVNALQGISIKIGAGSTVAYYHLDDVNQVQQWLLSLVK